MQRVECQKTLRPTGSEGGSLREDEAQSVRKRVPVGKPMHPSPLEADNSED